jgi:hypothetical protein
MTLVTIMVMAYLYVDVEWLVYLRYMVLRGFMYRFSLPVESCEGTIMSLVGSLMLEFVVR